MYYWAGSVKGNAPTAEIRECARKRQPRIEQLTALRSCGGNDVLPSTLTLDRPGPMAFGYFDGRASAQRNAAEANAPVLNRELPVITSF
jgi:hypothetical protein